MTQLHLEEHINKPVTSLARVAIWMINLFYMTTPLYISTYLIGPEDACSPPGSRLEASRPTPGVVRGGEGVGGHKAHNKYFTRTTLPLSTHYSKYKRQAAPLFQTPLLPERGSGISRTLGGARGFVWTRSE